MTLLDLSAPLVGPAHWPTSSLVARLAAVSAELDAAPEPLGPALRRRLHLLSAELDDVSSLIGDLVGHPGPAARPELVLDPDAFTARLDGQQLALTYREHRLLQAVVEHRGRALTRSQLMVLAWDSPPSAADGTRTIDVHVRRLRVKLGPAARRLVSVRRVGYRWD